MKEIKINEAKFLSASNEIINLSIIGFSEYEIFCVFLVNTLILIFYWIIYKGKVFFKMERKFKIFYISLILNKIYKFFKEMLIAFQVYYFINFSETNILMVNILNSLIFNGKIIFITKFALLEFNLILGLYFLY